MGQNPKITINNGLKWGLNLAPFMILKILQKEDEMNKILVSKTSNGKIRELSFDSIWEAVNYLQNEGHSDYEISLLVRSA